jgi:Fe-S cluster biogenesis protein NfuA
MEIKLKCPYPCCVAIDFAYILAKSNPACRGCGDSSFLEQVVISEISDIPIMRLKVVQDPWLVQNLQRTLYKTWNSEQDLCESCEELSIFREKLFKDPGLIQIAYDAGKKFANEQGGCSGCESRDDSRRMRETIVPEIHPFIPLLLLQNYQGGKLLPKLREAFINGYRKYAPPTCGDCCSD